MDDTAANTQNNQNNKYALALKYQFSMTMIKLIDF